MSRQLYREFYLLPRGEQRALILLSLLLILSLLFRISVQLLPDRKAEGMEEFEQEARLFRASLLQADSLGQKVPGRSAQMRSPVGQVKYPSLPPLIDINRADSVHLLPLPGIGPVYAGRIIKYRNLLGGYAFPEQLTEVYGINRETVDRIMDRIVVDTSLLVRLDLNSASFSELLRHPYLEYEDVKALVNYREYAGTIQGLKELEDNFILPDSVLNRISPYLDL